MHTSLLLSLLPAAFAAPLIIPRDQELVPGKFIVKFEPDSVSTQYEEAKSLLDATPDHEYSFGNFRGFAGSISDENVKKIQAMSNVEYIIQDGVVHTQAIVTQPGAPWGLGRISHIEANSTEYAYDDSAGEGTCSYIIDTGIFVNHTDFEGRAEFLQNFSGDGQNNDGNGHGTHVAGTIGSKTYGVAKKTKLYGVKVLNAGGSGTNSGVIAGINFVANDAKTRGCPKGAVANLSLGGARNTAVNAAVADGVAAGVFYAIAAGNSNRDAVNYSPASEPTACTVGATDISDNKASFSNFGELVDIFAPGVQVLSTWSNGQTNTISGTSMATPHIAGLGAYLLALENIQPSQLCQRIVELAQKDKIKGLPAGTKNLLAYNGATAGKRALKF